MLALSVPLKSLPSARIGSPPTPPSPKLSCLRVAGGLVEAGRVPAVVQPVHMEEHPNQAGLQIFAVGRRLGMVVFRRMCAAPVTLPSTSPGPDPSAFQVGVGDAVVAMGRGRICRQPRPVRQQALDLDELLGDGWGLKPSGIPVGCGVPGAGPSSGRKSASPVLWTRYLNAMDDVRFLRNSTSGVSTESIT